MVKKPPPKRKRPSDPARGIRLPPDMWQALELRARQGYRSVSAEIKMRLEKSLTQENQTDG